MTATPGLSFVILSFRKESGKICHRHAGQRIFIIGKSRFTCLYKSWIKCNDPPRFPRRVKIRGTKEYAGVVELADTYDLGSYVVRHAGSSPVARTTNKTAVHFKDCRFIVQRIPPASPVVMTQKRTSSTGKMLKSTLLTGRDPIGMIILSY